MIYKKQFLPIIISSLSSAFSFYYYCWGMAPFFFMGILYWWFLHNQPKFLHGLLWGVIFFTIHGLGAILYAFWQGAGWLRLGVPFFYVCQMSFYSALWFWLMGFVKKNNHYNGWWCGHF